MVIEKEVILIPNKVFELNVSDLAPAKYTLQLIVGDKAYNAIILKL